ncbi:MAG: hypothetical protein WA807_01395, partial [Steroidobacteraceae bacterium]
MKICNSFPLLNTWGRLASAMRRAASTAGRSSLIFASLVLAATIILPSAAFAATVGAVGSSPTLHPAGGNDPTINFSFSIGGYAGSGSLTATNEGGGMFLATGGTLTMSSSASDGTNITGNTYCLVPAVPSLLSPLGVFLYDDVITPGLNPVFPDIYGLLFTGPSTSGCPWLSPTEISEINIWAGTQQAWTGIAGQYSFYESQGDGYPIPVNGATGSFSATVVTTTYSYTGNAFNLFYCGAKDCSTPEPSPNPYGTNNSVTAALQMAAPLQAGMTINVLCSPNFVNLTLNDGVNTISTNTICGTGATAWVVTDPNNGNIINWYLDATAAGGEDIHTLYDPSGTIAAAMTVCTGMPGCNGYGSDDPKGEDKGTSTPPESTSYYGYVLNSPGTFLVVAPGQGGSTTAGNCTVASPCQLSSISSTAITAPSGVPIPHNAPLTQS